VPRRKPRFAAVCKVAASATRTSKTSPAQLAQHDGAPLGGHEIGVDRRRAIPSLRRFANSRGALGVSPDRRERDRRKLRRRPADTSRFFARLSRSRMGVFTCPCRTPRPRPPPRGTRGTRRRGGRGMLRRPRPRRRTRKQSWHMRHVLGPRTHRVSPCTARSSPPPSGQPQPSPLHHRRRRRICTTANRSTPRKPGRRRVRARAHGIALLTCMLPATCRDTRPGSREPRSARLPAPARWRGPPPRPREVRGFGRRWRRRPRARAGPRPRHHRRSRRPKRKERDHRTPPLQRRRRHKRNGNGSYPACSWPRRPQSACRARNP